jgi:hypothetical protein
VNIAYTFRNIHNAVSAGIEAAKHSIDSRTRPDRRQTMDFWAKSQRLIDYIFRNLYDVVIERPVSRLDNYI